MYRGQHVLELMQGGQIVDDELNQILVNPLGPGVKLHAIIDACHSGSVLDLEYRAEFQNGVPVWTNEYSKRPHVYKVKFNPSTPGEHGFAQEERQRLRDVELNSHVTMMLQNGE